MQIFTEIFPDLHIALFCYPSERGSKIERCDVRVSHLLMRFCAILLLAKYFRKLRRVKVKPKPKKSCIDCLTSLVSRWKNETFWVWFWALYFFNFTDKTIRTVRPIFGYSYYCIWPPNQLTMVKHNGPSCVNQSAYVNQSLCFSGDPPIVFQLYCWILYLSLIHISEPTRPY